MKALVVAGLSLLLGSSSIAQSNWKLDSFSFFEVPSAGITYQMRQGEIPLQISPSGAGRWTVRLPKSAMGPRGLRSSSVQASVELVDDGVGELVLEGSVVRGSLTLKLQVTGSIDGRAVNLPVVISLTTGHAEKLAGTELAAIDGVPLDPSSGQIQLVAVGINPAGLGPISGRPYYVVLSGRVENLPADMR